MATTKNITMKQFNGTDYDTLYPKTVYNQVSGVAPAGYGLGETLPYIAKTSESGEYDADTIDKTGFFAAKTNTPTGNWCYGLHVNRNDSNAFQLLTNEFSEKEFALRKKISGVWQPWEWVNPPMKSGVEYRTTKRYMEKPVYAKLVNFGAMPNTAAKTLAHGISDVQYVVSLSGDGNWSNLIGYRYVDYAYADSTNIYIKSNADLSTMYAHVVMEYTKSTD